jgi:hypothetical protein
MVTAFAGRIWRRSAALLRNSPARFVGRKEGTMIDITTNKPLRVIDGGEGASYIRLAVSQLDEVRQLLGKHGIQYWLSEDILSINGGPEKTNIHISRRSGPAAAQAVLDSVP